MPLKTVFMGTPAFAVPALRGLLDSHHPVLAVYSQPPRPAGRGQKLTASPIHHLAEAEGIPVHTPLNFKSPDTVAELRGIGADVAIVAAYGLLLPKPVLESFPLGCINIHPSSLPRWRGAAPIHRTVLAGDTTTDICIMQMDEGLDTGDVLLRKTYPLSPDITTGKLHDWLAEESAPLLLAALDAMEAGREIRTPQATEGVTYAKKILKEEARIDWNHSATAIERQIRGLNPYPAAAIVLNGQSVRILAATVEKSKAATVGMVMDERLGIGTGNGILRPTLIQPPGKKPMATEAWLQGHRIPAGTKAG